MRADAFHPKGNRYACRRRGLAMTNSGSGQDGGPRRYTAVEMRQAQEKAGRYGGCLVMALGGLLAASDRRYRFSQKRNTAAQYA